MLILLAAVLLLGARMSHELQDNAGALRGISCALTHDSKVLCFMGGGNTAFEVEFFKYEGQSTRYGQRVAFFEGRLHPSEGCCFSGLTPCPYPKGEGSRAGAGDYGTLATHEKACLVRT